MDTLPEEIINNIIDLKLGYEQYRFHKTKYNIVINEINDYIDFCNKSNDNEITPHLLLDNVLNICFEEYIGKDPFNVMKHLYKEFYDEPVYLDELD